MKRIAIFGGSFNPIHNGHLLIARTAIAEGLCDEVWIMPSPQNPLKPAAALLDERIRLDMVRAAVENEDRIVASDFEFHLKRPTYTYLTLRALRREYPDCRFSLMIGGDNWAIFRKWRNFEEILQRHTIIIYNRPGTEFRQEDLPDGVEILRGTLSELSSTDIRRRLSRGEDVSADVPPQVLEMAKEYYS